MHAYREFSLASELFNGYLTEVIEEVSHEPEKRVYMTDKGVRAFTRAEAKTASKAQLIGLSQLNRVYNENVKQLQPEAAATFKKTLGVFTNNLHVTFTLDKVQLKTTAEVEGFGYKKANLDQICGLSKEGFGPYQTQVPAYRGISDAAIHNFIKTRGLDIAEEWQNIRDTHFSTDEIKREILQSKKFPEKFFVDCAELRHKIVEACNSLQGEERISLDQLFATEGLDSLIDIVEAQGERLMVRSTGKEDTKELANAGGNTSVANVLPTRRDVLHHLTDVVVSYVGEKSLKQRLGAGDPSLFDPVPFMPVLIQRMIGERSAGALPKCGVMFTEDSESAVIDDKGQTANSGITVIQSAYGHNEAVVSSLIPVDSYYINDNQDIFPIIRPKTYRMMPTEKSGELQLVANHSETTNSPSLSLAALTTLKNFSERLEQFYEGPMDVEFVVDEKEQTIYIVQARPLVHRKEAGEASYLDVSKLGEAALIKGSAIGTAGGAIRLGKPSQFLVAPTLSNALDQYQDCEDPLAIEGVVVGKMAPSTSHWATSFRTEKKPVLYTEQWDSLQSMTNDADAQLLMSPQQGLIVNLNRDQALSMEDLERQGVTVKGWIDYPAAPLFSAHPQFKPKAELTEEAIQTLCPALKDPHKWEEFKKYAASFPLQQIFERLRHSQGENLQLDLAVLLFQFKRAPERHSETLDLDSDQEKRIEILQSYALALAESVNQNGSYEEKNPNYCRKLLPLHFLHALVYGQAASDELVNGHSLTSMALNEMREEQKIMQELQKQGITLKSPYSLTLLRFEKMALAPDVAKLYKELILALDCKENSVALKTLATLVVKLNGLDLLSAWLNVVLPKNPDPEQLADLYTKQAPFFEELAQKRKIANALNISAFGYAKSFSTQWQVLNSELVKGLKSAPFADSYKKVDISGKLACISLMNKVVDQFDLSIKALEGSSEYTLEKKLKLFQMMLQGYCGLASSWLKDFFPPEEQEEIALRLKDAKSQVDKPTLTRDDLQFSKYFDVQAFGSRSGASLGRVMDPRTLEDGFSVIHQELLTMLSILNQKACETAIPMPPLLNNMMSKLHLGRLTGTELNGQGLTLHFTHALREHGVQYTMNALPGSTSATLAVRFSAQNENNRWDKIAHYVIALKIQGKFDLKEIDLSPRGVGFTFGLDEKDNLQSLYRVLDTLETASTEIAQPRFGVPKLGIEEINKIENDKKLLSKWQDLKKIVQEVERGCGLKSTMECHYVLLILRNLVKTDPGFVESFLKKRWKLESANINGELDLGLPRSLVASGHAIGTICTRGIELSNSIYEDYISQGIGLLKMVAEKDAALLPVGIAQQTFKVLLKGDLSRMSFPSLSSPYENALIVLDHVMKFGKNGEEIKKGLIAMLDSQDKETLDDALKVLDLVVKHQPNYSSVKVAIIEKLSHSSIEQTLKQEAFRKLSI